MDQASCQYCGCEIEGKAAFCIACETPHHRDCFEENGKCTTYACECTSFFDGASGQTIRLKNEWSFTKVLGGGGGPSDAKLYINDYQQSDRNPSMGSVLAQVGAVVAVIFFMGTGFFLRMADDSSRRAARRVTASSSYRRDSWGKSTKKTYKKKVDWTDIRTLKGTLQTAVMRNNIPLATRMLNMGAPAAGKWFGSYPLEIAASRNYKEMCQLLVNHGAHPRSARTTAYLRSAGIKASSVNLEKADGRGY